MDRADLEKYLDSFSAVGGAGLQRRTLRGALDIVCLPSWRAGVARSWLQSSISSAQPSAARFVHYYRTEDGLGAARRRLVWEAACRRFTCLLEQLNAGGAKFDTGKAAALSAALADRLESHAAVIVSAEWLPGSAVCSKATVYLAVEHALDGAAARELASLAGGPDWLRKATAEKMGLLGADFYPDGRMGYKVYRRYLASEAPLGGACLRMAGTLRRAGNFISVYMAYKAQAGTGKIFLDKAHFQLNKPLRLPVLEAECGAGAGKVLSLYKQRAAAFSRLMCVNTDTAGKYFEVYFA